MMWYGIFINNIYYIIWDTVSFSHKLHLSKTLQSINREVTQAVNYTDVVIFELDNLKTNIEKTF